MSKIKTEHLCFGTHVSGMEEHAKFIEELNSKNGRIVHAWTEFGEYSHSHLPKVLNYIVEYKTETEP